MANQIIMGLQLIFVSTFAATWACLFLYDQILLMMVRIKEKRERLFHKNAGYEQFMALLEQNSRLKALLNGELEERN